MQKNNDKDSREDAKCPLGGAILGQNTLNIGSCLRIKLGLYRRLK